MSKITNNSELMDDLMNYSPYGALCQGFIIQAIQRQCKKVIDNAEQIRKEDKETEGTSIVNVDSWIGVAEDIDKRMKKFYSR